MLQHKIIHTERLKISYYHGGTIGKPKILFIHGNASSAIFYCKLIERLADDFEMIAPDLRCFGDSESLPIDATRGMRDWSDDIHSLVEKLEWDKFIILGWSMGGGVAMQYAIDHSERLTGIVLEAPVSPFGFGGTYDVDGKKLEPVGISSGGGTANQKFIQALIDGDREFMRATLRGSYVANGYICEPEWEEKLIDGIASTKVGEGMYPGDFVSVPLWPMIASGANGICNTMSPDYCDLSSLANISKKPYILWIRGNEDKMVSDNSMGDLAQLGALGVVPGWPGEEMCPHQPMVSQTRYVLDNYVANGGEYKEIVFTSSSHGPHIDKEEEFAASIKEAFAK